MTRRGQANPVNRASYGFWLNPPRGSGRFGRWRLFRHGHGCHGRRSGNGRATCLALARAGGPGRCDFGDIHDRGWGPDGRGRWTGDRAGRRPPPPPPPTTTPPQTFFFWGWGGWGWGRFDATFTSDADGSDELGARTGCSRNSAKGDVVRNQTPAGLALLGPPERVQNERNWPVANSNVNVFGVVRGIPHSYPISCSSRAGLDRQNTESIAGACTPTATTTHPLHRAPNTRWVGFASCCG